MNDLDDLDLDELDLVDLHLDGIEDLTVDRSLNSIPLYIEMPASRLNFL